MQGDEPTVMYQFYREVDEGFHESQTERVNTRLYKINKGLLSLSFINLCIGNNRIYVLVFMFCFHY